jgi:hypothetical protein
MKSHETLSIEKIEFTTEYTIISLSVENQTKDGWFCADNKIYLQNSIGKERYELIKSENIPICPDKHSFKQIGEILRFTLYFSPIDPKLKYLDLVEDCDQSCMYFKGIFLDFGINKILEEAYMNFAQGNSISAAQGFEFVVNRCKDYPYGFLHFILIKVYADLDFFKEAKKWYKLLSESTFSDKNVLIEQLKDTEYFSKLQN